MKRIVIKFGGSSVGTIEKIINAAKIVKRRYEEGNEVMVVVSAMSGTTNDLINRSKKLVKILINPSWMFLCHRESKYRAHYLQDH